MSFKHYFEAPYSDKAKWDSDKTQLFFAVTKSILSADMGTTWDTGVMPLRYHIVLYTEDSAQGSYYPPRYKVVGEGPLRIQFYAHPTAGGSYYDQVGFKVVVYSFNW